jgi:hypothetical protein
VRVADIEVGQFYAVSAKPEQVLSKPAEQGDWD